MPSCTYRARLYVCNEKSLHDRRQRVSRRWRSQTGFALENFYRTGENKDRQMCTHNPSARAMSQVSRCQHSCGDRSPVPPINSACVLWALKSSRKGHLAELFWSNDHPEIDRWSLRRSRFVDRAAAFASCRHSLV